MPQVTDAMTCANCSGTIEEAEAKEAGWRYWPDGSDLHLIYALCAHREFHPDAPASTDA
jgi:hypothetical protein